jgi:hypothetical protein
MKMRTARTAGLVGGLATGALLLTGTAAQAADTEVPESTGDLVMATPEALGGLPVSPGAVMDLTGDVTDNVPGMDTVSSVPGASAVNSVPGVNSLAPEAAVTEASALHPAAGVVLEPSQLADDLQQAVPGSDSIADAVDTLDDVQLALTEANGMPEAKGDKVKAGQDTSADADADVDADKKTSADVDADQNTSAEAPTMVDQVPAGDLLSNLGGGLPVPLPF